jgi:glycine/D-amino acid oxidase-like deaminating enzyme
MRLSLRKWRDLQRTWPGGVDLLDVDWLSLDPQPAPDAALLGAERLDAEQIERLVPGLPQRQGGLLVRRQGRVNPLRAIARLAAGLPMVATGVEVQAITCADRRVQTVQTSAGAFRPRTIVFCTGGPPRLDGLDLPVPAGEVKGHMVVSQPTSLSLPAIIPSIGIPLQDGRLMRGGTLDLGDDERVVRPAVVSSMWAELQAAWPAAREARVSHAWACFRPAHPDAVPVIDRLPGLDNAWLTSGHYKTGILAAPATAAALADWIASDEADPSLAAFGLARLL